MQDERLTLRDLTEQSGLDERVIRSYIQQDLLRGAEARGRGAYYSRSHLDRLLAIRALKDRHSLPLSEVRRRLLSMSEQEIRGLAGTWTERDAEEPVASQLTDSPSALAYLRAVRRSMEEAPAGPAAVLEARLPPAPGAPNEPMDEVSVDELDRDVGRDTADSIGPVDRLLLELQRVTGHRQAPRRVAGEIWFRLPVTPDVELAVRGIEDSRALARFERLADYLRDILLGS